MSPAGNLVTVCAGAFCQIRMTPRVKEAFDRFPPAARARMGRAMERYATSGRRGLPQELFTDECRKAVGDKRGTQVMISTFKVKAKRVYGALISVSQVRVFACTACDSDKKQKKARPEYLDAAARNLRPYLEREQ